MRICLFMVSIFLLREKSLVDEITQAVQGQQVHFQNARPTGGWYADLHIVRAQQTGHLATVTTTEYHYGHVAGEGSFRCLDEAAAVTRGGDHHQNVTRLTQCPDLLGVDLFEAMIGSDGADGRHVGGQRHAGQRGALGLVAVDQLGDEQLRQCGRRTVTACQHLVAIEQADGDHLGCSMDGIRQRLGGCDLGLDAFGVVLFDAVCHRVLLKCVPDPVWLVPLERDHIESAGLAGLVDGMLLQIVARCQHDLALFCPGDRGGGAAMAGLGAVADLNKHQGLALVHDEIDFAAPAAVVAGHRLQTLGLQPAFSH